MRRWIILLLVLSLSGCAKTSVPVSPEPQVKMDWPPGTILVSRNLNESDNNSPGYWNHLQVYVGDGEIVESQLDRGVILTPLSEFLSRKYQWIVLFPKDDKIGAAAAVKARTLVGLPYNKVSSFLRVDRNQEKGLNCVSVVRVSYSEALGRKIPELRIPDDILKMTDVFTRTGGLKPYPVAQPQDPPLKKAA
jgi:uncharacterized protein YycO